MRVFVAGATGALGQPLVRALVHRGHEVIGLTRSASKRPLLESLGARAAVADALDADTLERAVVEAAPTHVVHLLTALPPAGPMRASDLTATNEVRVRGTANLLRASIDARATRLVAESFVGVYGRANFDRPRGEDEPLPPPTEGGFRDALLALRDMEAQLATARASKDIETVTLRFGGFYGPDVASLQATVKMLRARRIFLPRHASSVMSFVHVDDAAAATVAALEHPSPGAVYNVVDDEPMSLHAFLGVVASAIGSPPPRTMPAWLFRLIAPLMAEALAVRMPLSNAKAKRELGWKLVHARAAYGMRQVATQLKTAA